MAKQASKQTTSSKGIKPQAAKPTSRSAKVDYYPNRMSLAIAASAVCVLILLAVIVVYL